MSPASALPTTEEPLWENTTVQNLIRYRPSGTYFARFKLGGKLIRQGLETAVFSVAKQRLPDKIGEDRSRHESVKAFAGGKMTVADAVDVYRGKVRANASLQHFGSDAQLLGVVEVESAPSSSSSRACVPNSRAEAWLFRCRGADHHRSLPRI